MRTVVTGASGLVGANLVRALMAQGREVVAIIHRDSRSLVDLIDLQTIQADLGDQKSLDRAFIGAQVVYHLAGSISLRSNNWTELEAVNVLGTCNVIQSCLRCGVGRLIHFSSIHALQQEPLDKPLDENRARVPLTIQTNKGWRNVVTLKYSGGYTPPYERSKAAAELEVEKGIKMGLNAVTIIPTAIVGPYDFRPSYFGQALMLLVKGRIPALVSGGYDWVDVRDVAVGAIQAEQLAIKGDSYILSGHWHSIKEVAGYVAEITGTPTKKIVIPLWLAQLVEPIMVGIAQLNNSEPLFTRAMLNDLRSNRMVSHARAKRVLGYTPRPFRETLVDTITWFSVQQERRTGK